MDMCLVGFLAELIISLILTLSFVVLNSALKESMVSVKRSFCELTSVNNSGTTFVPFFLRFTTLISHRAAWRNLSEAVQFLSVDKFNKSGGPHEKGFNAMCFVKNKNFLRGGLSSSSLRRSNVNSMEVRKHCLIVFLSIGSVKVGWVWV